MPLSYMSNSLKLIFTHTIFGCWDAMNNHKIFFMLSAQARVDMCATKCVMIILIAIRERSANHE